LVIQIPLRLGVNAATRRVRELCRTPSGCCVVNPQTDIPSGQIVVAGILSKEQRTLDFNSLTADQLSQLEDVIQGHLERRNDNMLLANL
jgi:hypothetical protein